MSSELTCVCGHLILDEAERISYKAALIPDAQSRDLYGWALRETMAYVAAVTSGTAEEWLSERGYPPCYLATALNNGVPLMEHMPRQYQVLARQIFECEHCGRVHIESERQHQYVSYAPDRDGAHGILERDQTLH